MKPKDLKSEGERPYLPEGFVEIDGVRFKVLENKQQTLKNLKSSQDGEK